MLLRVGERGSENQLALAPAGQRVSIFKRRDVWKHSWVPEPNYASNNPTPAALPVTQRPFSGGSDETGLGLQGGIKEGKRDVTRLNCQTCGKGTVGVGFRQAPRRRESLRQSLRMDSACLAAALPCLVRNVLPVMSRRRSQGK